MTNNSHVHLRARGGLRVNHPKSRYDTYMLVKYQDAKYIVHSSRTTRLLGSTNNETTIPTGDVDTVIVTSNNSTNDRKAIFYKIVYFFVLISIIFTLLPCLMICGACLWMVLNHDLKERFRREAEG